MVRATEALPPGEHEVSCRLTLVDGGTDLTLDVDGSVVATERSPHGIPFTWQHGGTALRIGYDVGFPVVDEYESPFEFGNEG